MKFLKLFEEAVKVCDYKKWQKYANWNSYKEEEEFFKLFPDHDKNYNRIYFPLKINKEEISTNDIPRELRDYIEWNGYKIVNYADGLIKRYHTGYDNGGIPVGDSRVIRIGKYLNKVGRQDLLDVYNNSKKDTLKNVDDIYVVISRHPYDLIGMSTNRGWSTCLDLDDDRYNKEHIWHLSEHLKNGYLISYLIRKDDRNINNPISRMVIKKIEEDRRNKGHRRYKSSAIYGTYIREFDDMIREWAFLDTSFTHSIDPENFKDEYIFKDFIKKYS